MSECQLVETFSKLIGKSLVDNQIEIVDTDGTAFYQFMMLFNSSSDSKRLPLKSAFITDEDQYTKSKNSEFDLDGLIANDYAKLNELREGIKKGKINGRVANMKAMANSQSGIKICSGAKTLEYQICKANVSEKQAEIKDTWLYELLKVENKEGVKKVEAYLDALGERELTDDEQIDVALLIWKCLPGKAEFAQNLSHYLIEKIEKEDTIKFTVPSYIQDAINHLVP